jgi:hypothetical protein
VGRFDATAERWSHESVRTLFRQLAATIALTTILACSGLGLCWREFSGGHDCCVDDATISAPAQSCASDATAVSAKLLPPPVDSVSLVPQLPGPVTAAPALRAFGSSIPAKAPPLVLRI